MIDINSFIRDHYDIKSYGMGVNPEHLEEVKEFYLGERHNSLRDRSVNTLFINTFSSESDGILVEGNTYEQCVHPSENDQVGGVRTAAEIRGWDLDLEIDPRLKISSLALEVSKHCNPLSFLISQLLDEGIITDKSSLEERCKIIVLNQVLFSYSAVAEDSLLRMDVKSTFHERQLLLHEAVHKTNTKAHLFLIAGRLHLTDLSCSLLTEETRAAFDSCSVEEKNIIQSFRPEMGSRGDFIASRNGVILFPKTCERTALLTLPFWRLRTRLWREALFDFVIEGKDFINPKILELFNSPIKQILKPTVLRNIFKNQTISHGYVPINQQFELILCRNPPTSGGGKARPGSIQKSLTGEESSDPQAEVLQVHADAMPDCTLVMVGTEPRMEQWTVALSMRLSEKTDTYTEWKKSITATEPYEFKFAIQLPDGHIRLEKWGPYRVKFCDKPKVSVNTILDPDMDGAEITTYTITNKDGAETILDEDTYVRLYRGMEEEPLRFSFVMDDFEAEITTLISRDRFPSIP